MPKISLVEVTQAYALSKRVRLRELTESEASQILVEKYGMNPSSSNGYVRKLRQMLDGECYTRTMNMDATKYYLDNILADFGPRQAAMAVQSVLSHLDYYPGGGQPGLRKVVEVFSANLLTAELGWHEKFDHDVEQLMADPGKAQQLIIEQQNGLPKKALATSTVFMRNTAVAALTRLRAKGHCEWCRKPAPFKKKSNGLPFLEVHHRQQLAHGGSDTLENTLAVCPNCHRELHYG